MTTYTPKSPLHAADRSEAMNKLAVEKLLSGKVKTMHSNLKIPGMATFFLRVAVVAMISQALCPVASFAVPQIPGADPKQPVALVGGTIHTVSGDVIEGGILLFERGRIVAVGKTVEIPESAKRVDVQGKHLYPGLFDAQTNMGLVEINSVRATIDETEVGDINPNVRAQAAFNPDSEHIPVTRSNGVLLTGVVPAGSLLRGRAAVMQLDGWTWEDMAVRGDVAMHLRWPTVHGDGERSGEPPSSGQLEQRERQIAALQQTMERAKAYHRAQDAEPGRHPIDVRWESLRPVLQGVMPVAIEAWDISDIQAAVSFSDAWKLKMILVGGYDALDCAELLKSRNIPVVVSGVHRLPLRRSDDYDAAYTFPARLHAAGIRFCISSAGRFGAANVRNLGNHAGMAVAFGLNHNEALKAITLSPAQILGVADRVGSLEAGKDATLIMTDGDPLETTTQVLRAFVQGREVDLGDRHKSLAKKYEEKLRRQSKP